MARSSRLSVSHLGLRAAIVFSVIMIISNKSYQATQVITCSSESVSIRFEDEEKQDDHILQDVTICNTPICRPDCTCSLGLNVTYAETCDAGNQTVSELIFPSDPAETLYFGNRWPSEISPFAFNGIGDRLKRLYLNQNVLVNVYPGAFIGLVNLEYLSLYENELNELRLGVFEGLDSLLDLDLRDNDFSRLQPGIFRDTPSLQLLFLDDNGITEIRSGTFDGAKNIKIIDFDENLLQHLDADVFHELKDLVALDLDKNKIATLPPNLFCGLSSIEKLELDENFLREVPRGIFKKLVTLTALALSYNLLHDLQYDIFEGLQSLEELYLQHNLLTQLHPSLFVETLNLEVLYLSQNKLKNLHSNLFLELTKLKILSLAQNDISTFPGNIFRDLHGLEYLNIAGNYINEIPARLFIRVSSLVVLDVTENPLHWITKQSFEGLSKLTIVYVDEYATCCFIDTSRCSFNAEPSPFITCQRLLPFSFLRVIIWLVAISTLGGNAFVLLKRFKKRKTQADVQYLLITNLAVFDILSGVYLFILLSADLHYKGFFPTHSESWRHVLCRFAGCLSLLSCDASVFFITLISIDRFMSIRLDMGTVRLNAKSAKIAISALWFTSAVIGLASALIPLISPALYDVSEICVGLPISRVNIYNITEQSLDLNVGHAVQAELVGSRPSMFFSIAIFTVINLFCFLVVAVCYTMIFMTAKQPSRVGGLRTNKDREIRRALKMAALVLSDFCCWMIVLVLSILVQGNLVTLNPVVYAWIATFLLPINSCMNPFLYTFSSLISKRLRQRSQVAPSSNNTGISVIGSSQPGSHPQNNTARAQQPTEVNSTE